MKLVLMTYYIGLHDELAGALSKLGVSRYTRWREVEGKCCRGDRHEGSQVWPGMNSALMVVVDADVARSILSELVVFNRGRKEEGVDAYVLDVAEVALAGKEGPG